MLLPFGVYGEGVNSSKKAQELVNQLAITDGSPQDKNSVARELVKMGEVALPSLIKGLGDRRPSRPLYLVSEQFMTVSVACTCILMELIYKLPDDYPGSLLRKGADGRMHRRPVFNSQIWGQLDEDEELKTWLGKRSSKSLKEIQIEAMSWIIKTEKKIGFQNDRERVQYVVPLEARLRTLQKEAEQADGKTPEASKPLH